MNIKFIAIPAIALAAGLGLAACGSAKAAPAVTHTVTAPAAAPKPTTPAPTTAAPAPVVVVPAPSSPIGGVERPAAVPAGNAAARVANTKYSTNWSGYVAQRNPGSFSSVKASWTEPKVYRNGSGWQMEATWVGLDGFGSPSVEQIGTAAEYNSPGRGQGTFDRFGWVEMYPGPMVFLPHIVLAGNHMTASVVRQGTHYTLTITNLSRHWTDRVYQTGSAQNSSAEAIVEAPTSVASNSVIPLTDFRNAYFTNTTINGRSARSQQAFAVDMVNASDTAYLDTVSPISASGNWSAHWDRSR